MKQKLPELNEEIDKPTAVLEELITPHLVINRRYRQKISKNVEDLNSPIYQFDLTYGSLHPCNQHYL